MEEKLVVGARCLQLGELDGTWKGGVNTLPSSFFHSPFPFAAPLWRYLTEPPGLGFWEIGFAEPVCVGGSREGGVLPRETEACRSQKEMGE